MAELVCWSVLDCEGVPNNRAAEFMIVSAMSV